jgi:hypothetical protein
MKKGLVVLCCLVIASLICSVVNAYSETIELPARDGKKRTVDLNAGDVVSGHVTLVGNAINFSISNPEEAIVLNYTLINPTDFKFTASMTGTYSFHFENWFSDEVKFVSLNYNVQHYIFGVPQEYFLLFIVVVVALIAIVVFVAMSPKP